jgi:hypothetical protein
MMAGGLEPPPVEYKATALPLELCHHRLSWMNTLATSFYRIVMAAGLEPATFSLRGCCSAVELCHQGRQWGESNSRQRLRGPLLFPLSYIASQGQAGVEPASSGPQPGALPLSYCPADKQKGTGQIRTAVIAFAEQRLATRPRHLVLAHLSPVIDIIAFWLLFVKRFQNSLCAIAISSLDSFSSSYVSYLPNGR